jgi:hypothetical protein
MPGHWHGATPPRFAEDIRDLQQWPPYDSGGLRRWFLLRQGQVVERTGDRSQQIGGDLGIV